MKELPTGVQSDQAEMQIDRDIANQIVKCRILLDEVVKNIDPAKLDRFREIEKEFEALLIPVSYAHLKHGESKVCAEFDYAISLDVCFVTGKLHHSPIMGVRKEFRVDSGLVDRVLFHKDHSITAIEIKNAGSRRDHAQGIGQVLMYAQAMREAKLAHEVHMALVVSGNADAWVEDTCRSVGIAYINIPLCVESLISDYSRINRAILNKEMAA